MSSDCCMYVKVNKLKTRTFMKNTRKKEGF